MSRQAGGRAGGSGGGVGTRGPGETKIETDRRRIRDPDVTAAPGDQGHEAGPRHPAQPAPRQRGAVDRHVGYTNAGKSSLLNALTGAGVLVQNALFATLVFHDPASANRSPGERAACSSSPTPSGSVRHLPTQLVEAFRSTRGGHVDADLLIHVVDGLTPTRWPDRGGATGDR